MVYCTKIFRLVVILAHQIYQCKWKEKCIVQNKLSSLGIHWYTVKKFASIKTHAVVNLCSKPVGLVMGAVCHLQRLYPEESNGVKI